MKGYQAILPLAALASAFVIPEDAVMQDIKVESNRGNSPQDILHDVKDKVTNAFDASHDAFDSAVHAITSSFEEASDEFDSVKAELLGHGHGGHDHDHPHHPHDPSEANLTVYQLITQNKYTTKFAELVNKFDDVVQQLNKTSANVTVFAPTDEAFEKIPEHHHTPSKELLAKILAYHIVPGYYPAGRVFGSHTLPTALDGNGLSYRDHGKKTPQRINVKLGFTGLFLDSYSRVVYPNVFGTNGVTHAVDSILVPPPAIEDIIKLSPQYFSTLTIALLQTGFKPADHRGSTLFAPPNSAWAKLGPRVNAFLFSKYGTKYLKAIVEYHIVFNHTLYSDAYYGPEGSDKSTTIPKGIFHIDLPTQLEDKSLAVDIARYGRFIELKVNAFTRAIYQDGVAHDGVMQVIDNVLIPPKKVGGGEDEHYHGQELSVEELVERLRPFVEDDGEGGQGMEL